MTLHSRSDSGRDPTGDRYPAIHRDFRWAVTQQFNIAEVCSIRWAREQPHAVAIRWEHEDGRRRAFSYRDLQRAADRLSHALSRLGIGRGDRVAVVMPQRFETAVAHIAIYQLGAVAMPLSMLFGPEALAYRFEHSETTLALVDESAIDAVLRARSDCPRLSRIIAVGAAQGRGDLDWDRLLDCEDEPFNCVRTAADDPAVLIYTSGTTGPPKGALIPHRALIGNLSGFICSQNGFGFSSPDPDRSDAQDGIDGAEHSAAWAPSARERPGAPGPESSGWSSSAVLWSPADWAWTGGLMDALLPTLYFGREIVAFQGRFTPERAFELLQRYQVTHSFLFPTALKAMMKAVPEPRTRYALNLQAIMSAGEAVGDTVFAWCRDALDVTVNEMFGQTEVNYIVGNCTVLFDGLGRSAPGWPARAGSMGRAYPGHRVAVIDEAGIECPRGTPGEIAVHRRDIHGHPDPVFFLGYWKNDEATRAKFTGSPDDSWCRTGDMAVMDADGYLWYQGRSDDMFKAAGYRIGPSEIENCLVRHPAVANAAVVPKPDPERGAVVKAYVVLAQGFKGTNALVADLQDHVRGRLAPYEYPKEIEFIGSLPMTTTGKVQRRLLRLREEERARAVQAPDG